MNRLKNYLPIILALLISFSCDDSQEIPEFQDQSFVSISDLTSNQLSPTVMKTVDFLLERNPGLDLNKTYLYVGTEVSAIEMVNSSFKNGLSTISLQEGKDSISDRGRQKCVDDILYESYKDGSGETRWQIIALDCPDMGDGAVSSAPVYIGIQEYFEAGPSGDGGGSGSGSGTGGGTTSSTPNQTQIFELGEEGDLMSFALKAKLQLSEQELNWLKLNPTATEKLYGYAFGSSSADAPALTREFIDALMNGDHIDVPATLMTLDAIENDEVNATYSSSYFHEINKYFSEADLSDPGTGAIVASHFSAECAFLKFTNPTWSSARVYWEASKEMIHLALGIAGLAPGIGIVFDAADATMYAIEGDGINATLSATAMVPGLGWGTTAGRMAIKAGWKMTTEAGAIVNFGKRNSKKFRESLGLQKGDPRQAHHIIPWNKSTDPIVQKAAKSNKAFHMNEVANGIPLNTSVHRGSHKAYDDKVQERIENLRTIYGNDITPDEAFEGLMDIANDIKTAIKNNPNTHVNDLIF